MKKIFLFAITAALMFTVCGNLNAQAETIGADSVLTLSQDSFLNATTQKPIVRTTHWRLHNLIARWIKRVDANAVKNSTKGQTNGVAPLNAQGQVPAVHIPTHGHAQSDVINLTTDLTALENRAKADASQKAISAISTANDYTASELAALAQVARTGSYNDLADKPAAVNLSPILARIDSNNSNIKYGQPFLGEVTMFAGSNVPQNYLMCDGRMLKKTEYPALYSTISGQFGENSDSFRLPNLTEKFVRGGVNRGATGGVDSVTLTENNLPSHTHAISGEVKVGVADQEGIASAAPNSVLGSRALETSVEPPIRIEVYVPGTTATFNAGNKLGAVSHNLTTASAGTGTEFSITPPYIILSYIIRVQ